MDIQSARIVAAARDVLRASGYFVDNLWHADDVNFLCSQLGYPSLSSEETQAVFEIANAQFDGEFGICWPRLEKALQTYMQQREMLEGLCEKTGCTQSR